VLLNRGGGSLGARRDYVAGPRPHSVAIADLNGDGKPDLATANESPSMSVLINAGHGRFPDDRKYTTNSYHHGYPHSIVTGDANGDGRPDLLLSTDESVFVLVNRGNGSFEAGVDHPTNRHPSAVDFGFSTSVATGDLNGDKRPDLVTANYLADIDNVSVLINRPGLCPVQDVADETLSAAKQAITHARCRVGKISRAPYRAYPGEGRVISQKPEFGAVLPIGSKVNLVVSRGPRR
jgi:hypothetical protein